ncbi:hypothetical protein D3C76_1783190 [compost metagenome]
MLTASKIIGGNQSVPNELIVPPLRITWAKLARLFSPFGPKTKPRVPIPSGQLRVSLPAASRV